MVLRPKGAVCALCNRGDYSMHNCNCASCETPIRYNESAQVQAIHRDGRFLRDSRLSAFTPKKVNFFQSYPCR